MFGLGLGLRLPLGLGFGLGLGPGLGIGLGQGLGFHSFLISIGAYNEGEPTLVHYKRNLLILAKTLIFTSTYTKNLYL